MFGALVTATAYRSSRCCQTRKRQRPAASPLRDDALYRPGTGRSSAILPAARRICYVQQDRAEKEFLFALLADRPDTWAP